MKHLSRFIFHGGKKMVKRFPKISKRISFENDSFNCEYLISKIQFKKKMRSFFQIHTDGGIAILLSICHPREALKQIKGIKGKRVFVRVEIPCAAQDTLRNKKEFLSSFIRKPVESGVRCGLLVSAIFVRNSRLSAVRKLGWPWRSHDAPTMVTTHRKFKHFVAR